MNKQQICELVKRQAVQNGLMTADDSKRVSLRQVAAAMEQTYSDLVFLMIKDEMSSDYFTKSYKLDINYDEDFNEYYCDLTFKTVQLPENKSIVTVRLIGSDRKAYPARQSDIDLIQDMLVKKYYDRILYLLDGQKKLIFKGFDYASKNVRSVNVKAIVSFSEYDWDEEVSLPSGKLTEITNMLAKTLFQNKRVLDLNSDGNPQ